MRKVIALLIVVSLAFSFPVFSFAQQKQTGGVTIGASASLDGHKIGEAIQWVRSVNDDAGTTPSYDLITEKRPTELKYGDFADGRPGFPVGFLDGVRLMSTEESNGIFRSVIRIHYPAYTQEDYEKYKNGITGAIIVCFEDGTQVEFTVHITLTNAARLNVYVVDENQQRADIWSLKQGNIYTIKLEVTDPGRELEGASSVRVKWRIYAGNNRIRLVDGNGEIGQEAPSQTVWEDKSTVSGSDMYKGPLPFGFKFYAKNPGKFDFSYDVYRDSVQIQGMGHGAVIEGKLDIVGENELDNVFADASAPDYTITLNNSDTGLDESSFKTIWDKAAGKPVNIEVEGGISMTFDTSENISGFLDDLKKNNGGVFNPSVNPAIPNDASNAGFSGGKWVEFMHSGKLPGKVTVKLPISNFPDDKSINLWYYDSVARRATLEPAEVKRETIGGVEYAVFTITHCSAYALYPAGQDPNPILSANATSSNKKSDSGSSTSADWSSARERIRNADSGDVVLLTLPHGERLPSSVLRVLAKMDNVTLKVRYGDKTLNIPSKDAANIEAKDYTFNELLALFGDKQGGSSEEAGDEKASKANPGTGAYPVCL